MEKQCENCKYYDIDYEWDDLSEDEVEIEKCIKGHDIFCGMECCEDFKKYKSKPYKEEFSECDTCEFLSNCGNAIESTLREDTCRHFAKGNGYCQKKSGEINKKRLSEIIRISNKISTIHSTMISVLENAIDKFVDITFEEFAKVDIFKLMEE